MNRFYTRQFGFGTLGLLIATLVLLLGGYAGDTLFDLLGAQVLQEKIKFLPAIYALFLAPVWVLYADLKKLKDRENLNIREAREVSFIADKGVFKVLKIGVFYIFSAIFIMTFSLWPTDNTWFIWLPRVAGSVLFISMMLLIVTAKNMHELSQFESKLAARKRRNDNSKKLLEEFKT